MPIIADTKSLRSGQNVATLLSLDKIKTPSTGLVLLILSEVFIVICCCLSLSLSGSDIAVLAHEHFVVVSFNWLESPNYNGCEMFSNV